jgi:hypothetical protein
MADLSNRKANTVAHDDRMKSIFPYVIGLMLHQGLFQIIHYNILLQMNLIGVNIMD